MARVSGVFLLVLGCLTACSTLFGVDLEGAERRDDTSAPDTSAAAPAPDEERASSTTTAPDATGPDSAAPGSAARTNTAPPDDAAAATPRCDGGTCWKCTATWQPASTEPVTVEVCQLQIDYAVQQEAVRGFCSGPCPTDDPSGRACTPAGSTQLRRGKVCQVRQGATRIEEYDCLCGAW